VSLWPAVGVLVAGVVSASVAAVACKWPPGSMIRLNHANRPVPVVLGMGFSLGVVAGAYVSATGVAWGVPDPAPIAVAMATGLVIVVLTVVGALDDRFGDGARGLRGHLGSLAGGRPTTGILKLVAGVAAAVILALHLADDPVRIVGIAVLVALCTNLWNALDVVPGRALKWALVVLVPVLATAWSRASAPVIAATVGAALGVLPFDLRERGMLGDAGSNPVGFLVGLALAVVLPTPALLAAAGLILLLQVAAETVTISRLIAAVPPLRWFDALGRRRQPDPRAQSPPPQSAV
jgi:UDP-N-acetylmuramyl pentapeptide phosphotransferase/UDP-N-acetylglucosamine-1-phosphate transferase